jgi:hypothetical protein
MLILPKYTKQNGVRVSCQKQTRMPYPRKK